MVKKVCLKCGKEIDTIKDLYVLLGTYDHDRTVDESFFHMICWRQYFEEKAKNKAMAVVNGMQQKMMPIAKQMTERLKSVIGQHEKSKDEFGNYFKI